MSDGKKPALWQAATAEGIATGLFVFVGAGTVVAATALIGSGLSVSALVAIALAHGFAIALLVAATAAISGGHINPAVTVTMMATRQLPIASGIAYIVAQLAGAAIGAGLLAAAVPGGAGTGLGAHGIAEGVSLGGALIVEIVLTFVLLFVIFAVAVDKRGPAAIAPLAIGLAIVVDHFMGVALTGASMNPARTFGPALVTGQWADHWVYWVGPLVGGLLAGFAYQGLFLGKR